MSITPAKPDRRIRKLSITIFFMACWLIPVIPVNYELQPLWSYISEFVRCLRKGYFFTATGYGVLLIFLGSVAFLLSVSLAWLLERLIRAVQRKQPEKERS